MRKFLIAVIICVLIGGCTIGRGNNPANKSHTNNLAKTELQFIEIYDANTNTPLKTITDKDTIDDLMEIMLEDKGWEIADDSRHKLDEKYRYFIYKQIDKPILNNDLEYQQIMDITTYTDENYITVNIPIESGTSGFSEETFLNFTYKVPKELTQFLNDIENYNPY